MTVHVLFFGQLRERLDCASIEIDIDRPMTVTELCLRLSQAGETWRRALAEDLLCAVNQTLRAAGFEINPGDEVALFPPVTGG